MMELVNSATLINIELVHLINFLQVHLIDSITPIFHIPPLISVIMIIVPVFTVFMFSFPTPVFNCNISELEQLEQYDSPLSEFQCRGDNKEHEYKMRIDRKRSLAYFY